MGAATLWCRELGIPTVRELGRVVGRSPVTVLRGFEHLIDVYAEVIRSEWALLEDGWHRGVSAERVDWLVGHAASLAAVDAALLRLPALVRAAVVTANPSLAACAELGVAMPLLALAAFAEPGASLPPRGELRHLLVSASVRSPSDATGLRLPA